MIGTERAVQKKQQIVVEYLLVWSLFLLFGFWVNAGIQVKGLYMDDLYLWSCYGEYPLLYYLFPTGGSRFRFLFNALSYPVLKLMGTHIAWTVPINIILNGLIALTVYICTKQIGRKAWLAFLCGVAYLLSRFSYYQISQLYGLLETFSLWGAILILYLLFCYLNRREGAKPYYIAASILYFCTSFIHERYLVLVVLLTAAVILRHILYGKTDYRQLIWPAGAFVLIMGIRYLAIGSLSPAGTGGSNIEDTFSVMEGVRFALSQVLYIFGMNAGPGYLNGIEWALVPRMVKMLVFFADAALTVCILCFFAVLVINKQKRKEYFCNTLLFLLFLAMCIGASSVTIRVEMRWVYVSYTAALFLLSYMYRAVKETGRGTAVFCSMIAVYVTLLFPIELYYRSNYENLYFWENQKRYNSLADVTYGTYGDDIFDKTIIILKNQFKIDEFTKETFWKPYRKNSDLSVPQVIFADNIDEFGLIEHNMLVFSEDAAHDRYLDVTPLIREQKCNVEYGYYEDTWMDQKAKLTILSGHTGEIRFDCYYPAQLNGGEKLEVWTDGKVIRSVPITANSLEFTIPVEKNKKTELEFKMNFHIPDALELRGEDPLGMLVTITAD